MVSPRIPLAHNMLQQDGVHRSFCIDVDRALGQPGQTAVVAEANLERLPSTIRRYLRTTGAVGHERVLNMHVRMHGRIRSGLAASWMPFTAGDYRAFGHARLGSRGMAIWHEPDGPFAYVEIEVDEIAYNVAHR